MRRAALLWCIYALCWGPGPRRDPPWGVCLGPVNLVRRCHGATMLAAYHSKTPETRPRRRFGLL